MKTVDKNGNVHYFKDNTPILHREGGPAIELKSGYKYLYINDKLHRLNGPAIETPNDAKYWYYNDKIVYCKSQEEFERLIKLIVFW